MSKAVWLPGPNLHLGVVNKHFVLFFETFNLS